MPAPTMRLPASDGVAGTGAGASEQPLRYVADRTFVWRDGVWVDTSYDPEAMTPVQVQFLSDEYFALLDLDPVVGEFLALGERVIFVWDGTAYEIVSE